MKIMTVPEKYAKWNGIPREEIDWHPTIDASKCTGCGMCDVSCGREVFDFNQEMKKSEVSRPLQCMVGCTSCKAWCIYNAISFPDEHRVKDFIKQKHVLPLVKRKLEEKLQKKG
jgi:NAD-dependent dihydropyrimidine dehydrogenase PreA subunit